MQCFRCDGLVVEESLLADEMHTQSDKCWRCLNCGWRGDTVSEKNKQAHTFPHHGTMTDYKTGNFPQTIKRR